jgi:hypothetical protein
MKRLNLFLLLLTGGSAIAFGQNEIYRAKVKQEMLPEKLMTAVSKDFPNNDIVKYEALPITMVHGELFILSNEDVPDQNYDTYIVTMEGKSGKISATYDSEGHLMSTTEHLKNVPLPKEVLATIGKDYRGWAVKGDHVILNAYHNDKKIAHYKVKLEKGGMIESVVFDAAGKVVKVGKSEEAKEHHVKKIG